LTLVDTNVLLDLFTKDPVWARWSMNQLDVAAARGPLIINDVVYAELSVRFSDIRALNAALGTAALRLEPTPRVGLFLAGRVFQRYRAAGGSRTGVLPDFFIGAHAAVAGWPLITRDMRRYRTYFPRLVLITP
jgi:hypothetical protein